MYSIALVPAAQLVPGMKMLVPVRGEGFLVTSVAEVTSVTPTEIEDASTRGKVHVTPILHKAVRITRGTRSGTLRATTLVCVIATEEPEDPLEQAVSRLIQTRLGGSDGQ